ncbi:MAG: GNAT family N-acetyltransferase [Kangiellaceae bacterium]|nr:GNAT family N-acetyltransferase [Kangiellaceae bacterium]
MSNNTFSNIDGLEIIGFQPGAISTLCAIQSEFYARAWGFNHLYESVVAASVGEFLTRYDPEQDFIQLVLYKGRIEGGIAIDHRDGKLAQLRWFIVTDQLRGFGVGKFLIEQAMSFVKRQSFSQVYLTTFEGLDSARKLYEKHGFKLTSGKNAATWGKEVNEQRFDWFRNKE